MSFTCASATRISARALSGALALALALAAGAADAKRLGGGSSSGRQSSNVSRSATPQQAAPA
ncbi:MAG: hypothetical protein MO847_10485, partial [Candidatus Protistobacter heckmanni]|nr:hypothetical protein [Candidatus Protistobacter heckmanni]